MKEFYIRPRGSNVRNSCKPQNPNKKHKNKGANKLARRVSNWESNPGIRHIHHKPGSFK